MNNSDKRIREVAIAATVSECFLFNFINSPIKYLFWSGSYWSHVDMQRNSQSKLLDKWVDSTLARYFKNHKDPLKSRVYPLKFEKNIKIEKYSGLDDAFSKGIPRKEIFNGTVEDYKKQKK